MRGVVIHSICLIVLALNAPGQSRECLYSTKQAFTNVRVLDEGATLYVPVVVHVIYGRPEVNISDEQIQSQMKVLNQDFSMANPDVDQVMDDFRDLVTSANIQFFLAKTYGENGIIRVPTTSSAFGTSAIHYTDRGGSNRIKGVLNIWVCDLASSIAAYSKTPEEFDASEVGVVIDYEFFGTTGTAKAPFNGGRTLTHEVGHWLGLAHLWGAEGCGDGDQIEDTPQQEGPALGCDLTRTTCQTLDMVQNFMNLSEDACLHFFTAGQVLVMRQMLLSQRPYLNVSTDIMLRTPYDVSIYPNPASKHFYIENIDPTTLTLYDAFGRQIAFKSQQTSKGYQITPHTQSSMIYIMSAEFGMRNTQKLILKN